MSEFLYVQNQIEVPEIFPFSTLKSFLVRTVVANLAEDFRFTKVNEDFVWKIKRGLAEYLSFDIEMEILKSNKLGDLDFNIRFKEKEETILVACAIRHSTLFI